MSASSKKKLRNAAEAEKLTERQLQEQKEAKKLKIQSIAFIAVLAVMVVAALTIGITTAITNSTLLRENTTAVTAGDQEIDSIQFNYFYIDGVQKFVNKYGSYASMFGLDTTKPLNEQVIDEASGTTWADNFMDTAKGNLQSVYAVANEAKAKGYTLTEADVATVNNTMSMMELYADMYGYPSIDDYLKAIYGTGASADSYRAYYEVQLLAQSYNTAYAESLTYSADAIRAKDDENPDAFNAYTYNSYYLAASRFLTGGTTDENGATTYSDAEKAASVTAAEAAANSLVLENGTALKFDEAIAALEINADTEDAISTPYKGVSYSSLNSIVQDWVTDPARKAGDMAVLPSTSSSTAEDGTETTTTNGYYVVLFGEVSDNKYPLVNARHILVSFEGGTTDANGNTTYTDAEKAAAKSAAEALLETWKSGEATEDSFAALATENSTDTGSTANGGLYEDIYPGQMVTNFNDWCFDESRKTGDTGIVESTYGYHVMYFVGDSDIIYRDFLIENQLRSDDVNAWYNALLEATVVSDGNDKYVPKDLIITRG